MAFNEIDVAARVMFREGVIYCTKRVLSGFAFFEMLLDEDDLLLDEDETINIAKTPYPEDVTLDAFRWILAFTYTEFSYPEVTEIRENALPTPSKLNETLKFFGPMRPLTIPVQSFRRVYGIDDTVQLIFAASKYDHMENIKMLLSDYSGSRVADMTQIYALIRKLIVTRISSSGDKDEKILREIAEDKNTFTDAEVYNFFRKWTTDLSF